MKSSLSTAAIFFLSGIAIVLVLIGCPTPNDSSNSDAAPISDAAPMIYTITISLNNAKPEETVTVDTSEATEGDTVTLTADLNGGRKVSFSTGGVHIAPVTISSDGGMAIFTMPATDLDLTAHFYSGQTRTANSVDFDMHLVPSGGPFTMGEHVEHSSQMQEVTLTKDFWMGETEVTQGLWEDVWGTTWPHTDPEGSGRGAGADYPAYYINWFDTVAFCNLLTVDDSSIDDSERVYYSDEDLNTVYTKDNAENEDDVYADWDKAGYRLPTEAEWEYAARYIDGTSWNNGDHASGDTEYACYDPGGGPESGSPLASDIRIGEYSWWEGNNSGGLGDPTYGSKEVGQKIPNALGLRDMSGNVWEWCYDRYNTYSGGSVTDPIGDSGSSRTSRSGYWINSGLLLRCARRDPSDARDPRLYRGFRLCRTAF